MSNSPNPLKYLVLAAIALFLFYVVIPFLFSAMWEKDYGTLRKALPAGQKAEERRAREARDNESHYPRGR